MRMIDADLVLEQIDNRVEHESLDHGLNLSDVGIGLKIAESIIKNAPEINVEEDVTVVRHGHWIKRKGLFSEKNQCSICKSYDLISAIKGNYCWNCGARMDEVEE